MSIFLIYMLVKILYKLSLILIVVLIFNCNTKQINRINNQISQIEKTFINHSNSNSIQTNTYFQSQLFSNNIFNQNNISNPFTNYNYIDIQNLGFIIVPIITITKNNINIQEFYISLNNPLINIDTSKSFYLNKNENIKFLIDGNLEYINPYFPNPILKQSSNDQIKNSIIKSSTDLNSNKVLKYSNNKFKELIGIDRYVARSFIKKLNSLKYINSIYNNKPFPPLLIKLVSISEESIKKIKLLLNRKEEIDFINKSNSISYIIDIFTRNILKNQIKKIKFKNDRKSFIIFNTHLDEDDIPVYGLISLNRNQKRRKYKLTLINEAELYQYYNIYKNVNLEEYNFLPRKDNLILNELTNNLNKNLETISNEKCEEVISKTFKYYRNYLKSFENKDLKNLSWFLPISIKGINDLKFQEIINTFKKEEINKIKSILIKKIQKIYKKISEPKIIPGIITTLKGMKYCHLFPIRFNYDNILYSWILLLDRNNIPMFFISPLSIIRYVYFIPNLLNTLEFSDFMTILFNTKWKQKIKINK